MSDNRKEKGLKQIEGPMSKEEKQDNCIVIIQVPLKQKLKVHNVDDEWAHRMYLKMRRRRSRRAPSRHTKISKADVEAVIVKVAERMSTCRCGRELKPSQVCLKNPNATKYHLVPRRTLGIINELR